MTGANLGAAPLPRHNRFPSGEAIGVLAGYTVVFSAVALRCSGGTWNKGVRTTARAILVNTPP